MGNLCLGVKTRNTHRLTINQATSIFTIVFQELALNYTQREKTVIIFSIQSKAGEIKFPSQDIWWASLQLGGLEDLTR